MNTLLSVRLSVMMFLQFFIWGAWYVTAPGYLVKIGFTPVNFGWTYSVGPIAGMISPFFVGMIADRFFSTERVLAAMHLIAAGAMLWATQLMQNDQPSAYTVNLVFFLHMLAYYPTLALTNSLALNSMTDPEKQFPLIRVFGTIGWIVAGVALTWFQWETSVEMFYLSAAAAAMLCIYSLTLPHTPPPAKGTPLSIREILGLDALVLLKRRSFLVFMLSSFLICIPLAFYYQLAFKTIQQGGVSNPALTMTYGQMSEIFFMLVMPLFFRRLGVKWMLFVGMLAWVMRYALFAVGAPAQIPWMLISGVVLHGICYDFFFVTGQIYTDKAAPATIRSQAQGMLVLFTLGLGMFIGAQVGGRVEQAGTPEITRQLLAQAEEKGQQIATLAAEGADGTSPQGEDTAAQLAQLRQEQDQLVVDALREMDWRFIWGIPAGLAAVILVVFTMTFRDDSDPRVRTGSVPAPDAGAV